MRVYDNNGTYIRDPTEDVSVETYMVFRYVYPPLNENLALKSTTIVYRFPA